MNILCEVPRQTLRGESGNVDTTVSGRIDKYELYK